MFAIPANATALVARPCIHRPHCASRPLGETAAAAAPLYVPPRRHRRQGPRRNGASLGMTDLFRFSPKMRRMCLSGLKALIEKSKMRKKTEAGVPTLNSCSLCRPEAHESSAWNYPLTAQLLVASSSLKAFDLQVRRPIFPPHLQNSGFLFNF